MSEILAKQTIKKAIKKIFSLEFEDFKNINNYVEMLGMCRNIYDISAKNKLIIKALEAMLIDNGKFKENIENDSIKYFDYLIDKKSYNTNLQFQKEFFNFIRHEKYSNIFKGLEATSKEKIIIEFICKIKEDFQMLFDCIDIIYSDKLPNYIPSQGRFSYTDDFEKYLELLESFLSYHDFEIEKEYISLEYDSVEGFYFKQYSYEDANILKEKIDENNQFKNIKKYISTYSVKASFQKEENKNYQVNNNECSRKQEIIKNEIEIDQYNKNDFMNEKEDIQIDSNEEKNVNQEDKKDYDDKYNSLKEELDEIKSNYAELMKTYNEDKNKLEIKFLKLEAAHNKDKKELEKKCLELEDELTKTRKRYDNKIRKMKKNHKFDINHLNNKLSDQKKDYEVSLNKEKEKYNSLETKYYNTNVSYNLLKKDNENEKKQ